MADEHRYCRACGDDRGIQYRNGRPQGYRGARGLCQACYLHFRKHGEEALQNRVKRSHISRRGLCSRCHINTIFCRGLCAACYHHWLRGNKPRPRHLWTENCLNCGLPLVRSTSAPNRQRPRRGLCGRCWDYQRKYGKPRPERLWRSEHGWCDCGHLAVITVKERVGKKVEKLPMCQDCYDAWLEMKQQYGN